MNLFWSAGACSRFGSPGLGIYNEQARCEQSGGPASPRLCRTGKPPHSKWMASRAAFLLLLLFAGPALADQSESKPATPSKPPPNMVPDLTLPVETDWNRFRPEWIPDFKIPKRFDPVLGTNMPVKLLIWHNVGRNMFRTVTNGTDKEMFDSEREAMLKKGISLLAYHCMRAMTEQLQAGDDPTNPAGLPFDSLTQVAVGEGCGDDSAFKDDWDKWIAWWRGNVDNAAGPLGAVRPGKRSPICMTFSDYESTYGWGVNQADANHLIVGMYAMAERSLGYVGQMYLGPLNTLGYIPDNVYTGGSTTFAWFNPANDEVPEPYRGKVLQGNPQIVAGMEVSHYMESFLPEGFMIKDQHGKDFVTVTHFGKEPTTEHWAARVGGLMEGCYQYTKAGNQHLIAQLKVICDRRSGYQYSPDDGGPLWNQAYNRLGITQSGPNNTEFVSPIGSEKVPSFPAEGQMLLACFSGAYGVNFWGSAQFNDFIPKPRDGSPERGEKHDDRTIGNVDRESITYSLKAFWRMAQKATLENGKRYSFYDICDGTEEYLNWNTQVSYDGGKTFKGIRALDWQWDKQTAVRAVVNHKKGVIFILAFQPYGVEQDKVVVKYKGNGVEFKKAIRVPANKFVMCAYELKQPAPPTVD
jgi:hypothetical protein